MPFVSKQQQKWGHSEAGEEALGGPEAVAEWDEATKGRKLPLRVGKRVEHAMKRGAISEHAVKQRAKKRRRNPYKMSGLITGADYEPKASSR